jgi:hypothetical protein
MSAQASVERSFRQMCDKIEKIGPDSTDVQRLAQLLENIDMPMEPTQIYEQICRDREKYMQQIQNLIEKLLLIRWIKFINRYNGGFWPDPGDEERIGIQGFGLSTLIKFDMSTLMQLAKTGVAGLPTGNTLVIPHIEISEEKKIGEQRFVPNPNKISFYNSPQLGHYVSNLIPFDVADTTISYDSIPKSIQLLAEKALDTQSYLDLRDALARIFGTVSIRTNEPIDAQGQWVGNLTSLVQTPEFETSALDGLKKEYTDYVRERDLVPQFFGDVWAPDFFDYHWFVQIAPHSPKRIYVYGAI